MIGLSVLGWVRVDLPISILSVLGLAFLLFLVGMEVALERLRGRLLVFVGSAFLLLLGLALLVGFGLYLAGQVVSPVLIAIILVATALGIVVPLLEDVDESASDFGQLITGAMFAEFDSIILLLLFFVYNKVRATNRVLAWVVRKENSGAARELSAFSPESADTDIATHNTRYRVRL